MKLYTYQYPNLRASARTAEAVISYGLMLFFCAAGFIMLGTAARLGEAGAALFSIALLLASAGYAADRYNTLHAYVEVSKKSALVVSYSFFRRREYVVDLTEAASIRYTRTPKRPTEFISVCDKDGKRLFYVLRTPDADRRFARLAADTQKNRSRRR